MKNNKKKNRYFIFTFRFLAIFIIFQLIGNVAFYLKDQMVAQEYDYEMQKITYSDSLEELEYQEKEKQYIVIGNSNSSTVEEVIIKALEFSKSSFEVYDNFDQFPEEIPSDLKAVFVCESNAAILHKKATIETLLKQGISVVFLQMPDLSIIEENKLYAILGIDESVRGITQKGVRFISDFLLGGLQDYEELEFEMASVKLMATTKTYAYGLENKSREEMKSNEDLPPVIWRNSYLGGQVFVINGPFINKDYGFGVISSILTQMHDDYIYPIVNGMTLFVKYFPFSENVNDQELKLRYSYNALGLQQDILMPSLISTSKKYDVKPSCFMTNEVTTSSDEAFNKALSYYKREINALKGEIGYITENIPVLGEAQLEKWDKVNDFEKYNETRTIIPIFVEGVEFTDRERLSYYAAMTSLGMISQGIDMTHVLYPQDDKDDWINISKELDTLIKRYREEFTPVSSLNVTEMVHHIKNFQMMKTRIEYEETVIKIDIDQLYGTGYFILRTRKEIENVIGGKYRELEENVYMIEANKNEIRINLSSY